MTDLNSLDVLLKWLRDNHPDTFTEVTSVCNGDWFEASGIEVPDKPMICDVLGHIASVSESEQDGNSNYLDSVSYD